MHSNVCFIHDHPAGIVRTLRAGQETERTPMTLAAFLRGTTRQRWIFRRLRMPYRIHQEILRDDAPAPAPEMNGL